MALQPKEQTRLHIAFIFRPSITEWQQATPARPIDVLNCKMDAIGIGRGRNVTHYDY